MPSFHSCSRPESRISRKSNTPSRVGVCGRAWFIRGAGRSRTISISNTKKITANKKNRRENGIRAELLGSKPHSKGDSFSRSWLERAAKNQDSINTTEVIRRASKEAKRVRCIV